MVNRDNANRLETAKHKTSRYTATTSLNKIIKAKGVGLLDKLHYNYLLFMKGNQICRILTYECYQLRCNMVAEL